MNNTDETVPNSLPYSYHHLPSGKVMILHPSGARICKTKEQIQFTLDNGYPDRPLSLHEKMMWRCALEAFDAPVSWVKPI